MRHVGAMLLLYAALAAPTPARADVIEDCDPWEHRVSTGPPPSGLRGHAPYECRFGPSCAVGGAAAPGLAWAGVGLAALWIARRSRA